MAGKTRKSGDSKLADAQAFRQKDQVDPQPLASIATDLQDAAEAKAAAGAPAEEVAATQRMLEQLAQVCAALETQNRGLLERISRLESSPRVQGKPIRLLCPTCHQVVKDKTGRGVCDGQSHVRVRVVPPNPAFWRVFQGVTFNGVTYANWCLLPRTIVQEVLAMANRQIYIGEMPLHIGKVRMFGDIDVRHAVQGATPIISEH